MFRDTSLPPVPLLSCTCTPGTRRSTSRRLEEPVSSMRGRSTMVRAPAWSSTFSSLGLSSQLPVTVMVDRPASGAVVVGDGACADACSDSRAAATAAAQRVSVAQ